MSCKYFSFYSYKGGSGRSTTLMNTTKHLIGELGASPNHPILIVDMDMESAGLTYYFEKEKKFTDLFEDCIHVYSAIRKYSLFGKEIFQNRINDSDGVSFKNVIDTLKKDFSEEYDLEALFANLKMAQSDMEIFEEIADIYSTYAHYGKAGLGQDEKKRKISKIYNWNFLNRLFYKIKKIHEDKSLSEEQKKEKKLGVLYNELPGRSVADVSEYFGEPRGTVKFLGVYVTFEGSQTVPGVQQTISAMRDDLSELGYKAAIFDSGAGTQSSANALRRTSDVTVCCMRPSDQFIQGTRLQLSQFDEEKKVIYDDLEKDEDKKLVILLPTAVPEDGEGSTALKKRSFGEIKSLVTSNKSFVDGSFCDESACLKEVALFKWREQILGTRDPHELEEGVRKVSDLYVDMESEKAPQDAKSAYAVYRNLAKKLIENS